METKFCAMCVKTFEPKVKHQSFCSSRCRQAAWKRTSRRVSIDYIPRPRKKKDIETRLYPIGMRPDPIDMRPDPPEDIATQEVPSIPPSNLVSEYLRRLRKQDQ